VLKRLGKFLKNIKLEIFLALVFVLFRIPLLGFDIVNTDAPVWKTRTFVFSNAIFSGDFAATNVTYHPGVMLLWLSSFGVKFYNLASDIFLGGVDPASVQGYVGLHFAQKLMLILFFAFCLVFILYILKNLFSRNFALLFFFIFTFEPYVLGLTRVLHTDALITFTSFAAVLALFYHFENKKILWLIVSGVFSGMAMLTKSNALFLFGFMGLSTFVNAALNYKNFKQLFTDTFKPYLLWLLFALFTFIILWPAMWVSPVATLQNYYGGIVDIGLEAHYQSWFGIEVADPGPFFYPTVIFIRLTPWFIILAASGVLLTFVNFFKYHKLNKLLLMSLAFVVLYIFFLTMSDKKLGRYALPTIPFLSLYATYTLTSFISTLGWQNQKVVFKKYINISIYALVGIVIVMLSLFSTYKFFPNYLMYYSPFVGGFEGGRNIEEPKWPIGYGDLARYLNSLDGAEERYVLVRFGYLYNPFNISGKTGTLAQRTEKDPGSYFVLEKYSDFRYIRGKAIELKKIIKIGDTEYFWVYEITRDSEYTKIYEFTFPPGMQVQRDY
jgi:4-amino-4-deoxy-L-arabinose transferase-like glycosyltransferase